jgi:hypothetical protein
VWSAHSVGRHDGCVAARAGLYTIRVKGRLGAGALSAFSSMAHELRGSEIVLTGWLEDWSALLGILAEIEGLGLELLELRRSSAVQRARELRLLSSRLSRTSRT